MWLRLRVAGVTRYELLSISSETENVFGLYHSLLVFRNQFSYCCNKYFVMSVCVSLMYHKNCFAGMEESENDEGGHWAQREARHIGQA